MPVMEYEGAHWKFDIDFSWYRLYQKYKDQK